MNGYNKATNEKREKKELDEETTRYVEKQTKENGHTEREMKTPLLGNGLP
jgi:hypothetical protein